MKIVAYPSDLDGAGSYRIIYPLAQLSTFGGHKCTLGPHRILHETKDFMAIQYDLDHPLEADLVILQNPRLPEYKTFQKRLQDDGILVVVEMDDDYLNLPDYNPASQHDLARSREAQTWCLRHADAVTVTTPSLKKTLSGVTRAPIYVLRNFLDWKVWGHVDPVYEKKSWEGVRVGYLGKSLWHSGDLDVLKPWLGKWLEQNPDVQFVSVGDPENHEILGVPEEQRINVDAYAFRHQGVARHAATMDIGLVPLAKNKFNESKSHLKGMEYAGVGIPCLASPTESYREWWLAGTDGGERGAGFLCDRPKEWVRALDRLVEDEELRTSMGRRARQLASENTIQDHWRLWENIYSETLAQRSHTAPPLWAGAIRRGALQKPDELEGLVNFIQDLPEKPKRVLEIGTAKGGTLWIWCQLCDPEALIVSVDLPGGDFGGGYTDEDLPRLASYPTAPQRLKLIRGDSHQPEMLEAVKKVFGDEKLDLLFIDGDHTLEGVTQDWEMYSPLVKTGGLVLFHDIVDHSKTAPTCQVKPLWDRLKENYEHHEFIGAGESWAGIGAIVKD